MVLTRKSIKFSKGDKVLCFEPDKGRASILYDAQILDIRDPPDVNGFHDPDYLVQLSKGSRSCKEYVKDNLLLPNTEENRSFQAKLKKRNSDYFLKRKRRYKFPPYVSPKKHTISSNIAKTEKKSFSSENNSPNIPLNGTSIPIERKPMKIKYRDTRASRSSLPTSDEKLDDSITVRVPKPLQELVAPKNGTKSPRDCKVVVVPILEKDIQCVSKVKLEPKNSCEEKNNYLKSNELNIGLSDVVVYHKEEKQYYVLRKNSLPSESSSKLLQETNPQSYIPPLKNENESLEACDIKHSNLSIRSKIPKCVTTFQDNILLRKITNSAKSNKEDDFPDKFIQVPSWKYSPVQTCFKIEGTEDICEKTIENRHDKYEQDERKQKKWDMQRIREQRIRMKLLKTNSQTQNDSLFPDLNQVKYIEVEDKVPVNAFFHPVPCPEISCFSKSQKKRKKSYKKKT